LVVVFDSETISLSAVKVLFRKARFIAGEVIDSTAIPSFSKK